MQKSRKFPTVPLLFLGPVYIYSVPPLLFLNIEGSCVSYCREWKMPFTLWYARSGCTGSISSARKKRLRAVSSLKSVLWCERGKCMQPRVHQLYMCVSVLLGLWRKKRLKDTQRKLVLHGFSELTCWFLQGLWCGSNRRLKRLISFLFQCLFADYCLKTFFTLGSFSLNYKFDYTPPVLIQLVWSHIVSLYPDPGYISVIYSCFHMMVSI